jgi:hypothetical protein
MGRYHMPALFAVFAQELRVRSSTSPAAR